MNMAKIAGLLADQAARLVALHINFRQAKLNKYEVLNIRVRDVVELDRNKYDGLGVGVTIQCVEYETGLHCSVMWYFTVGEFGEDLVEYTSDHIYVGKGHGSWESILEPIFYRIYTTNLFASFEPVYNLNVYIDIDQHEAIRTLTPEQHFDKAENFLDWETVYKQLKNS